MSWIYMSWGLFYSYIYFVTHGHGHSPLLDIFYRYGAEAQH